MMGVGARKRGLLRWGVVPWLHTRVKGGQRRPDPVPELPPQEPRQSPCSSPRPPQQPPGSPVGLYCKHKPKKGVAGAWP